MKKLSLGAFGAYYGNCDVYGSCRQVQPMTIRTVTHGKVNPVGSGRAMLLEVKACIRMVKCSLTIEMPTNRLALIPTPV